MFFLPLALLLGFGVAGGFNQQQSQDRKMLEAVYNFGLYNAIKGTPLTTEDVQKIIEDYKKTAK